MFLEAFSTGWIMMLVCAFFVGVALGGKLSIGVGGMIFKEISLIGSVLTWYRCHMAAKYKS